MKRLMGMAVLGCFVVAAAWAQFPGYDADPPVREHSGTVQPHMEPAAPAPQQHPEYKKLVQELERLQEELKTATDSASAARKQQEIAVAHTRLSDYIRDGKPTLLAEPPGVSLPPPPTNALSTAPVQPRKPAGFTADFGHYEQADLAGSPVSIFATMMADSGAEPLDWDGSRFEVESVDVKEDGQWIQITTKIIGELSPDGAALVSCELSREEQGRKKDGTTWTDEQQLIVFNVPLIRREQKPEGVWLSFGAAGETALRKHVVKFLHRLDTRHERKLIWEPLPENHYYGVFEPSLRIRLLGPKAGTARDW